MSDDNVQLVKSEPLDDADDSNDFDLLPPSNTRKLHRIRKSTAGVRKVQHEWKDREIVRLIAGVKKRRGLWDIHSAEYKLSKLDAWREVICEIGVDGIDVTEVKTKWSSLRVTFKTNLWKLQRNKCTIAWRHFKQMMFLADVRRSTSPSADPSMLDDVLDSDSPQPTKSQVLTNNQRRHRCTTVTPTPTPTPPASPLPSTSSTTAERVAIVQSNAVPVLPTLDPNYTFCSHILSELRTLPDTKARKLRRMLARTMYEFMDTGEGEPPQPVPPTDLI